MFVRMDDFLLITANVFSRTAHSTAGRALSCALTGRSKGRMKKDVNAQGRFPFEKLTKFYSFDQINQAAQDSERGGTIKPVIRLSAA